MPSREGGDTGSCGPIAELLSPLSRLGSSRRAIRRLTPAAICFRRFTAVSPHRQRQRLAAERIARHDHNSRGRAQALRSHQLAHRRARALPLQGRHSRAGGNPAEEDCAPISRETRHTVQKSIQHDSPELGRMMEEGSRGQAGSLVFKDEGKDAMTRRREAGGRCAVFFVSLRLRDFAFRSSFNLHYSVFDIRYSIFSLI